MRYQNGSYHFEGKEEDVAYKWMWDCLLDTSFFRKVELLLRILFKRPPERYWDI